MKTWKDTHSDYKSIINGLKYVLILDKSGATVLKPLAIAEGYRKSKVELAKYNAR